MKSLPPLAHHLTLLAIFCLGWSPDARAQMELAPMEKVTFTTSYTLPPGIYEGQCFVEFSPPENQSCTLEISQSVISNCAIKLAPKCQLRLKGVVLRKCQIITAPDAEVVIESSILEDCQIAGRRNPQSTYNTFRITNSLIERGQWLEPSNSLGLEMMNCEVRNQTPAKSSLRTSLIQPPLEQAQTPTIRFTKFVNCEVNASLFAALSQVTFENCTSSHTADSALFGIIKEQAHADIPISIRWVGCTPDTPPLLGGGLVIQRGEAPYPGGLNLKTQTQEGGLALDTMPPGLALSLHKVLFEKESSITQKVATSPTGNSEAGPALKLRQTHMNGLLIMQLPSGKMAGQVSRMNATAMEGSSLLQFSQAVGEDMTTAIHEVNKFVQVRHPGISTRVEISFEEKYSNKDGPSAAVACALLAESLVTGKVWDPAFAVTGDMNADGTVQPIGGVSAKVRGATKGACKIVAIPHKNANAISDIMVMDGLLPLISIHIFSIQSFEQAAELASQERPLPLQQALDEFAIIQSVVLRNPQQMAVILRTPQAVTRLQAIIEKAPHSLSARYLLAFAQGRNPAGLTISGSIEEADSNGSSLLNSIRNDFSSNVSSLQPDELGGTINRLRNLRPRLDRRVWPYVDAMVDYGEVVRSEMLKPTHSSPAKFNEFVAKVRRAAAAIGTTKQTLLANPQVQEELGL